MQIYEMVMGDVNGDVTTVLERAKEPIKDNRLVPVGFTTMHPVYDTTRIAGVPGSDTDFNRNTLGEEGSGTDVVRYHVPLEGYAGALRAHARVYYQPVPPAWNAEMFSFNSPAIDAFRDMLEASDGAPTLVATDEVLVGPVGIAETAAERVMLFPNPTADGWMTITSRGVVRMDVVAAYDVHGSRVPVRSERGQQGWRVLLPEPAGVYLLHLRVDGTEVTEDPLYALRHRYFNSEVHGMHHGEFANYAEHFATALLEDSPHSPDLEEGLRTFCVMEAVRRAAREGGEVFVAQIRAEVGLEA